MASAKNLQALQSARVFSGAIILRKYPFMDSGTMFIGIIPSRTAKVVFIKIREGRQRLTKTLAGRNDSFLADLRV